MKKFTLFLMLVLLSFSSFADGGMWLPIFLKYNEAEMKELGFRLTAEDVYSVNNHSMKDNKKYKSIYDITVKDIKGNDVPLADYKGKVLLRDRFDCGDIIPQFLCCGKDRTAQLIAHAALADDQCRFDGICFGAQLCALLTCQHNLPP